jgi:dsDNA-binding SOS-regulon protein
MDKHTHTHTQEEDPYGKMWDTSENLEDTSMGQNEPF